MKKIIIILCGIASTLHVFSQSGVPVGGYYDATPNPFSTYYQNSGIKDGWYEATISYSSNTGHHATYILNVAIESLRVVAIDFGNSGSVHVGPNNEGYKYSGGGLTLHRDRYGEVYAAETTIKITYPNGSWQTFDIYIE
ncbi:MAG: hypothetical protein MJZ64_01970 [Paludibacteraceae bacterium]|nr:hypothetical protein [Paludibacteraceae bacterium]